jgi:hypothetical protein
LTLHVDESFHGVILRDVHTPFFVMNTILFFVGPILLLSFGTLSHMRAEGYAGRKQCKKDTMEIPATVKPEGMIK